MAHSVVRSQFKPIYLGCSYQHRPSS